MLAGFAGVEVEGAAGAGEGLRQGGAVAVDLPTRKLKALPGEFQAPAPAIQLLVIHHRPGEGEGGAAPAARRDEHMPATAMDRHPRPAFLAVAGLEVIRAGDLALIEVDEHNCSCKQLFATFNPSSRAFRAGFRGFGAVSGVWGRTKAGVELIGTLVGTTRAFVSTTREPVSTTWARCSMRRARVRPSWGQVGRTWARVGMTWAGVG
jgi:hypothetical protein